MEDNLGEIKKELKDKGERGRVEKGV